MDDAPTGHVYVYGVIAAEERRPLCERGVGDARVRFIEHDGLCIVGSSVPGPVPGRRDDLVRHLRVLEELAADVTVLPFRFGTVFESKADAIEELLVRRGAQMAELCRAFDGTIELSVRAIYDEETIMGEILAEDASIQRLSRRTRSLPEDATYFDRVRLGELVLDRLRWKRDRDARAILERLSPLALDVAEAAPTLERMVLSASFLVRRDRQEEFGRAVGTVEADAGDRIRFRYTGPLPPYSFVSLDAVSEYAAEP